MSEPVHTKPPAPGHIPHQAPQPGAMRRDLGDEYLVYDGNGGKILVLNAVARAIYLLCDGQRSLREIAARLERDYEVAEAQALADVRATVARLETLGLLVADSPGPCPG